MILLPALLFFSLPLFVVCQSGESVCLFAFAHKRTECIQNPSIVRDLQARVLPEFSPLVSCFLAFSDEESCLSNNQCFYDSEVFTAGSDTFGQCYPYISRDDLPSEESAECFREDSIWRYLLPCSGLNSNETCTAVDGCSWQGEICGPDNNTITVEQRDNMAEAIRSLEELTEGDGSFLREHLNNSFETPISYFCSNVVLELLFCSLQNISLGQECVELTSWFWEDESDRELFFELVRCGEARKQKSQQVCEDFMGTACTFENGRCEINPTVQEYLLGSTISNQLGQEVGVQCLLHGNNENVCKNDTNCQYDKDLPNLLDSSARGLCDGQGVPGKERVVQSTIQAVEEDCFTPNSFGSAFARCIQYPVNLCPEECIAQVDQFRCIPNLGDFNLQEDVLSSQARLRGELEGSVSNEIAVGEEDTGYVDQDYCQGPFLDMLACVGTKRDYECGVQIVVAVFPDTSDRNLLLKMSTCDAIYDDEEECVGSSSSLVQLKSKPGESGALQTNMISAVLLSVLVLLLSLFLEV
eukprot:TRINITY_DN5504_c0_g2_i2.p1 TRINITY_DN5504_c0_g2~~TRINITY_DN5504_c0_g2_i2.p1  ORF type:complete len:527 (-),score=59.08 TRINITY_DN5504_c0_g2_i2:372-1952(-)